MSSVALNFHIRLWNIVIFQSYFGIWRVLRATKDTLFYAGIKKCYRLLYNMGLACNHDFFFIIYTEKKGTDQCKCNPYDFNV